VASVTERRTLAVVLACVAVCAAAAALLGTGEKRYRARAFVIQVPAAIAGDAALELARSDRVLDDALRLAGERDLAPDALRRSSKAELTSRLDMAVTVEAASPEAAVRLATGYAKAFRRAIPDDRGLPTRGIGARRAESELGPAGFALIGAMVGLGVGVALALLLGGLSRGSRPTPRPSSPPCAPARPPTRG
jgi:hypothetical protein